MLSSSIPAYLYTKFQDDDGLQAFVMAFNSMADDYVLFFSTFGLPIYTQINISGPLLDWIAQGLYGISRPSLSFSTTRLIGQFNTWAINSYPFNTLTMITTSTNITVTDDIFKRIITWHFYKGDGKVFGIKWLKRRIMRFLAGINGTDSGTDDTSQISVIISGNDINIRIMPGVRTPGKLTGTTTVLSGMPALCNLAACNAVGCNSISTAYRAGVSISAAQALQQAIQSGAVELPFTYTYSVAI